MYCFKMLSDGVVCYLAIDNQYTIFAEVKIVIDPIKTKALSIYHKNIFKKELMIPTLVT